MANRGFIPPVKRFEWKKVTDLPQMVPGAETFSQMSQEDIIPEKHHQPNQIIAKPNVMNNILNCDSGAVGDNYNIRSPKSPVYTPISLFDSVNEDELSDFDWSPRTAAVFHSSRHPINNYQVDPSLELNRMQSNGSFDIHCDNSDPLFLSDNQNWSPSDDDDIELASGLKLDIPKLTQGPLAFSNTFSDAVQPQNRTSNYKLPNYRTTMPYHVNMAEPTTSISAINNDNLFPNIYNSTDNLNIPNVANRGKPTPVGHYRDNNLNPSMYNADGDLDFSTQNDLNYFSDMNFPCDDELCDGNLNLVRKTPGGTEQTHNLRPIEEIPVTFRSVFKEFIYFNIVQSSTLDTILYTDKSLVVSAPTGSGKTVLLEVAIVKLLSAPNSSRLRIVYMAPMKALCSERAKDWSAKFSQIQDINVSELTGDTITDDHSIITQSNIICTTPEKWDSVSRRWRDNQSLMQSIKLFLVDEVHVLNDENRGSTVEVVISRMKTVHMAGNSDGLRFIAVSATIPNIEDVAEWFSNKSGAAEHQTYDESYRPVHLRKVVLGYPYAANCSEFKFDMNLSYKLNTIIQEYGHGKPTLIFCSTRKSAQQAAQILSKQAKYVGSADHHQYLKRAANMLKDLTLQQLITNTGIGYHHAGLDLQDRSVIEDLFLKGELPVLICTSTLAMGVNLPAHLVIVKGTSYYVQGIYQEYTETQVIQMVGRAGRPQFDTTATAVILTKTTFKQKFEALVTGKQVIESSLHNNLIEHINAEICLRTITDELSALNWIKCTFLFVRASKNPAYYNMKTFGKALDEHLIALCNNNIGKLENIDLVKRYGELAIDVHPTEKGKLMNRHCISFSTMREILQMSGKATLFDIIDLISKCKELQDVKLRMTERRILNALNKSVAQNGGLRFPLKGKIKSSDMKVNCLIQATFGTLAIDEFSLLQDAMKIIRVSQRLTKCIYECSVLRPKVGNYALIHNSLILMKCVRCKLWENSMYSSLQLKGIGNILANLLVNAGLTSFSKLQEKNAREIELIVNRRPPFGNKLREQLLHVPKYSLQVNQSDKYDSRFSHLTIIVKLVNHYDILELNTFGKDHSSQLLVGDNNNDVLYSQRITDSQLCQRNGEFVSELRVCRPHNDHQHKLTISLISNGGVGVDVENTFTPFYPGCKIISTESSYQHDQVTGTRRKVLSTPSRNPDTNALDGVGSTQTKVPCQHKCGNKLLCAHMCCKVGVMNPSRRRCSQAANTSSYFYSQNAARGNTSSSKSSSACPSSGKYSSSTTDGFSISEENMWLASNFNSDSDFEEDASSNAHCTTTKAVSHCDTNQNSCNNFQMVQDGDYLFPSTTPEEDTRHQSDCYFKNENPEIQNRFSNGYQSALKDKSLHLMYTNGDNFHDPVTLPQKRKLHQGIRSGMGYYCESTSSDPIGAFVDRYCHENKKPNLNENICMSAGSSGIIDDKLRNSPVLSLPSDRALALTNSITDKGFLKPNGKPVQEIDMPDKVTRKKNSNQSYFKFIGKSPLSDTSISNKHRQLIPDQFEQTTTTVAQVTTSQSYIGINRMSHEIENVEQSTFPKPKPSPITDDSSLGDEWFYEARRKMMQFGKGDCSTATISRRTERKKVEPTNLFRNKAVNDSTMLPGLFGYIQPVHKIKGKNNDQFPFFKNKHNDASVQKRITSSTKGAVATLSSNLQATLNDSGDIGEVNVHNRNIDRLSIDYISNKATISSSASNFRQPDRNIAPTGSKSTALELVRKEPQIGQVTRDTIIQYNAMTDSAVDNTMRAGYDTDCNELRSSDQTYYGKGSSSSSALIRDDANGFHSISKSNVIISDTVSSILKKVPMQEIKGLENKTISSSFTADGIASREISSSTAISRPTSKASSKLDFVFASELPGKHTVNNKQTVPGDSKQNIECDQRIPRISWANMYTLTQECKDDNENDYDNLKNMFDGFL